MKYITRFVRKLREIFCRLSKVGLEAPNIIYIYLFSNHMIGRYHNLKPNYHRVNLYDYHPELLKYGKNCRFNNSRYNLGDSLGFPIVNWMLKNEGGRSLDTEVDKTKFMNCVGSNLFRSFQNATIWGAGLLEEPKYWYNFLFKYPFTKYDIRAVRGPLTREVLLKYGQNCPEVYGDPAILMPLIYNPNLPKTRDLLVIPQFVSEQKFRENHPQYEMVSMNTNDYKYVIDQIVSSKLIVTSSLHGVILADAYGVPSLLFRGLGKNIDFKYYDYYYSTGRYNVNIADSFEEAMNAEPLPLPDLSGLQKGLLKSFPTDLWYKL